MIAACIFAIAAVHTFSTKFFEYLARTQPLHVGLWHLLADVEVVFGFSAMIVVIFMISVSGEHDTIFYLESRSFTEPMFVFAIMVVAGTRPVRGLVTRIVKEIESFVPLPTQLIIYFLILSLVPLLGSLITEPAAMTLAAMLLRDRVFVEQTPKTLKYASLAALFVNISIGGTSTPFAAPPVLMVATKWNWDFAYMISTFGWRALVAVITDNAALTYLGSLVDGLSAAFQTALVAGAVTGGEA